MSATYAGGSINIDEHRQRLTKELGKEPAFIETFTRTFQKKDKTWSGERAKAAKEKYDELEELQRSLNASENFEGSESSVGNNLNLWMQASGGPNVGGRVLGMSSLNRTKALPRNSTSFSPEVNSQIHSLTEEVTHLKGIISERDRQMEERDRQMEERDRQMENMMRQQNMIMEYFKLNSVPFQNPPNFGDDGGDDDGDDGGDGDA